MLILENDPIPELVAQLSQEFYNNDVLQLLVLNIWRFEFEVSERSSITQADHSGQKGRVFYIQ